MGMCPAFDCFFLLLWLEAYLDLQTLLSLNWSIANLLSSSKIFMSFYIILLAADIVLSSATLCRSVLFRQRSKSFTNKLNKIRPDIDPCGTPYNGA